MTNYGDGRCILLDLLQTLIRNSSQHLLSGQLAEVT